MKTIMGSIFGRRLNVIKEGNDVYYLDYVVECPHCKKPVVYGETRMISGYIGCDTEYIEGHSCFSVLVNNVSWARMNMEDEYVNGSVYGYNELRT